MLQLYDLLLEYKQTPMVILNRAIVLAQLKETASAIIEILKIENIEKLLNTQYIHSAVLGDLYMKSGDEIKAERYLTIAHNLTSSHAEKKLITEKILGD